MSFAIALAKDAAQSFAQLNVQLQERVLDEFEAVANAADSVPRLTLPLSGLHDIRVEIDNVLHYVFLTLEYDRHKRLLTVLKLAHYSRPGA